MTIGWRATLGAMTHPTPEAPGARVSAMVGGNAAALSNSPLAWLTRAMFSRFLSTRATATIPEKTTSLFKINCEKSPSSTMVDFSTSWRNFSTIAVRARESANKANQQKKFCKSAFCEFWNQGRLSPTFPRQRLPPKRLTCVPKKHFFCRPKLLFWPRLTFNPFLLKI